MKRKIYSALLLGALSATFAVLPCSAQKRHLYNGQIVVLPTELRQGGDSLYLRMELEIPSEQLQISSKRSLTLIPILEGSHGRMTFPKVQINGKNRHKAYLRSHALQSKSKSENNFPYAVVRVGKPSTIHYSHEVPFQEWMKDARLDMVEDLCGCGWNSKSSSRSNLFNQVALERVEEYVVQPKLAYIRPVAEPVKRRNETKNVFLDFKVGSNVIFKSLNNNAFELGSIEKSFQELMNNKNVQIQVVRFEGYASPEGTTASNLRLSKSRAESMKNYLISVLGLKGITLQAEGKGEDWNGLKELLNSSAIKNKEQLLQIIDQCGITDACKKKMQAVGNGSPYRQMLAELYPQLRRTICSIDYTVRGFNTEEAKKIITTSPQLLDLNEMYLVANEYPEGSMEFNEVFEVAVRMFPEDVTANLNAAASALSRKDIVSAEKYLSKIEVKMRIPEFDNSMGVLMLLKGEYDKAKQYFDAARTAGLKAAVTNMEELARKQENDAAIQKQKN